MGAKTFRDRSSAGAALGEAVAARLGGERCRVYGLARGGVVVARPVAERVAAGLEVVVACKVGAPGQPEYAVGAVAEGGGEYWDAEALVALGLDPGWCERAAQQTAAEVGERTQRYRKEPLRVDPDEIALVVDDGIATGSTVMAALRGLAAQGARRRAIGTAVASREAIQILRAEVEWIVALMVPDPFVAVGAYYDSFDSVDDEELLRALGRAA